MDDSAAQQLQQHHDHQNVADFDFGEYITNATHTEPQHQGIEMFNEFQQQQGQQRHHSQHVNLASTQNLMASSNAMENLTQGQQQQSIITNEMLNLKGRLEQQMKLQHLQQLILQQQIELINGQSSINAQQKDAIFHGLLTPGPSTELPAMVPKDHVPPMMLHADMFSPTSATVRLSELTSKCTYASFHTVNGQPA
ncbi:hypothetical protein K439DRAFT_1652369, partial [Ramaria rubella]